MLLAGIQTDAEISKKTVWELFQAAPESEVRACFASYILTDLHCHSVFQGDL